MSKLWEGLFNFLFAFFDDGWVIPTIFIIIGIIDLLNDRVFGWAWIASGVFFIAFKSVFGLLIIIRDDLKEVKELLKKNNI